MKLTRVMGLVISGVAALIAGIVAMRLVSHNPVKKDEIENKPAIKLVNVLVAARDMAMGSVLTQESMEWVAVPEQNVFAGFINDVNQSRAIEELAGVVVRMPILKGDPIRLEKLVGTIHGNGGYLSTILPKGKRAITVDISVSTAVGGMIVPNDYVDILVIKFARKVETVLRNIRVLAIDQSFAEEHQKAFIGTTATLEVTSKQALKLLSAQSASSKLILVLRSVSDSFLYDDSDVSDLSSSEVLLIKSGIVHNDGEEMSR